VTVRKTQRQTNKQRTDNRQSRSYAPLIHRITGGGRVLQPKATHGEDQPFQPAGSKCKKVITGLRMANKYGMVCEKQTRKKLKRPK